MILTIAKIVLIILIVIIGIVFILSLFSISYDIDFINNMKGPKAYIDIKYLLGAIRCKILYDKKLMYGVRIFSIIFNYKTPKKIIKYVEKYDNKEDEENLSYIFEDKDDFLSEDNKKKLIEDRVLMKKADKILMVPIEKKKEEKKPKKKKSVFSKILNIIKEKNHTTIKHLYGIIKDIIKLIKPKKVNVKFNLLSMKLDMHGKIRLIRLIYIALVMLMDNKIRYLISD